MSNRFIFEQAPGHLIRRAHQISVAVFADEVGAHAVRVGIGGQTVESETAAAVFVQEVKRGVEVVQPFVATVLLPDVEDSAGDRVVGDPGRTIADDESVRRTFRVGEASGIDHRCRDVDAVVVDAGVVDAQVVEQGAVAAAPVVERAVFGVDPLGQLREADTLAFFPVPVDPLRRSPEGDDFP